MLTYGDDQEGYPHPDHLRVHEVSMLAIDAAADAERYPEAGEPWQILKIVLVRPGRGPGCRRCTRRSSSTGLESPYDKRWFDRPSQDHRLTTHIDVTGLYDVRAGALKAHATQIDPTSPFWFGLPDEVAAARVPAGRLHPRPQRGAGAHARGRPLRRDTGHASDATLPARAPGDGAGSEERDGEVPDPGVARRPA